MFEPVGKARPLVKSALLRRDRERFSLKIKIEFAQVLACRIAYLRIVRADLAQSKVEAYYNSLML